MLSGAKSDSTVQSQDAVGQIGGSSPLAKGHIGSNGSTVVHRWIGTCNVTEELKAGGTDDVYEGWMVSTSADLLIRNVDPPGNA